MNIFKAKDILKPAPEDSETIDEFLVGGDARFSNRGKQSVVLSVQKKLNVMSEENLSDRVKADHDIEHIGEDVDGAKMIVFGAVREVRLPDGSEYTQTNIGLVPKGEGEKRTKGDLVRMAEAVEVMSEGDKEFVRRLKKES